MKTRVALLTFTLCLSALFSRAADPVIDALVAQIQANPASAPALTAQAAAANQALASDIFKAAFDAAPDQVTEIVKATAATAPTLAASAVEQALIKLTAGLNPQAAAKVAAATVSAAIDALPASTPPDVKSKIVAAVASSAIKVVPSSKSAVLEAAGKSAPDSAAFVSRKVNDNGNFPTQRPPIIVSPSR
jgi:hypothetical protein